MTDPIKPDSSEGAPEKDEKEGSTVEETETPEESEESTEESSSQEVDYEALEKAESERAGKPDPFKAQEAFKKRKQKHEPNESEEEAPAEDDDDKPLTRGEARELLKSQEQTVAKSLQDSNALAIIRAHTSSESEAKAAFTYWKTRGIYTGNLESDVKFVIGGINHEKLISKNKEMARAFQGKDSASHDIASTQRDGLPGTAPKMDAGTSNSYKRAGFVYESKTRVWKKKLPNGVFLFKDPKTKRTWTAK